MSHLLRRDDGDDDDDHTGAAQETTYVKFSLDALKYRGRGCDVC